jgi:hypothetical protein
MIQQLLLLQSVFSPKQGGEQYSTLLNKYDAGNFISQY